MNILLVDDEIPALNELEDAVKEVFKGANVRSFSKGTEAIEYAENNRIDVAFLDINMRFLDGIAMAKKLLGWNKKCNVVFCTGYEKYAMDALNLYCSGYILKPISEDKIREAKLHFRYPVKVDKKRVEIRCFGNFDVTCDGKAVSFKYKKTRELLAFLVDRKGTEATTREIIATIFDDEQASYFSNIRLDLINTFKKLGVSEVVSADYGRMRVIREEVDCDYFDYLDGKSDYFNGEYMSQYSFAEETLGNLSEKRKGLSTKTS